MRFGGDKILEYCDIVLDGVTQDTEMQKKVYLMGVLIGNGIKSGAGFAGGKGKFKFQDLIGMALPQLFPNLFKGQGPTTEQSSPLDWEKLNK